MIFCLEIGHNLSDGYIVSPWEYACYRLILCYHRLTYQLIGYNHLFGQNLELPSAKSVMVSYVDYKLYFLGKLGLAEWTSHRFLCREGAYAVDSIGLPFLIVVISS